MSKKTFLDKLRKRLSILKSEEIEDIIEEYEGHINEKVSSGKTEEEAIKDFGDFDELVKEILSAYKINEDYDEEKKEKNVIQEFAESCASFFKEFIENISKRSKEDIIRFVFEFIVLIIFIVILKLPVLFVEKLGWMVFGEFISPFGNILSSIWKYMIEIIYFILSVACIISFVKKRYLEGEKMNDDSVKSKETKPEEKNVDIKTKIKEKNVNKVKKESSGTLIKILMVIIKISLAFILIPAIFSFLISLVCLVIGFVLLFQGLPYIGIFLCGLTYVSLNYIFIDLCFRFIFNKKLNNKLLLGSIITTVVLFVIGVALSFYEVINTTYVDGVPSRYKKIVKEKQVTYTDDLNLTCDSFPHTNCTYEIDDSLNDNVVATVSYYDFNKSYEITDDLKYKHKENEEFSLKEFYDIFINDLKQRKIYNYGKLQEIKVTIKLSSDTQNKIIEKNKSQCNNPQNCSCNVYGCYDVY